jgi:hypothetical protein
MSLFNKLFEFLKWMLDWLIWLVIPDGNVLQPLFDMWDDIEGRGPFGLLSVVTWPAQQVAAARDGAQGAAPGECLRMPWTNGETVFDGSQGVSLFCPGDESSGWRETTRSVVLWSLTVALAYWVYMFVMGVIRK